MHLHILGICGAHGRAGRSRAPPDRSPAATRAHPMSTQFEQGIELIEGFGPEQLALKPDLYVIGNVVSRGNPLMEAILESGARYVSGPQWLGDNILPGAHVLVAGTHGKTTTSSMLTWILEAAGLAPNFLIGGVAPDPARLGPVQPHAATFRSRRTSTTRPSSTSARSSCTTAPHRDPEQPEYDHADIFPDLAAIETNSITWSAPFPARAASCARRIPTRSTAYWRALLVGNGHAFWRRWPLAGVRTRRRALYRPPRRSGHRHGALVARRRTHPRQDHHQLHADLDPEAAGLALGGVAPDCTSRPGTAPRSDISDRGGRVRRGLFDQALEVRALPPIWPHIETRNFHHLVRTIPGSGRILRPTHSDALDRVPARLLVGNGHARRRWPLAGVRTRRRGRLYRPPRRSDIGTVRWSLGGEHNRMNALARWPPPTMPRAGGPGHRGAELLRRRQAPHGIARHGPGREGL